MNEKKQFQCAICDYKLLKKGVMEKHRVSVHEELKSTD